MSVSEGLARSMINHAFKNPSLALKLFELIKGARPPLMEGQETAAGANEALIAGFLARELRRRGESPESGPKEPGSNDDEPGDE